MVEGKGKALVQPDYGEFLDINLRNQRILLFDGKHYIFDQEFSEYPDYRSCWLGYSGDCSRKKQLFPSLVGLGEWDGCKIPVLSWNFGTGTASCFYIVEEL